MSTRKRLSSGQKRILAGEAVDWIAALAAKRRPIPLPQSGPDVDPREMSIQMQLHHSRLKFQGYDVAMALHQILDLVQHLERRRIPQEVKDPLGRFLDAMSTGRLKNLRNAFVHYADDIAGVTPKKLRAKREDTWRQHQARPPDEVIFKAGTREAYKASLYSFGAHFNIDDGVIGVVVRGQSYKLLDALNCALELGPPLSRWSGRRLLEL